MSDAQPANLDAFQYLRDQVVPSTRIEGWTGERQRRFLEAVADGDTVKEACGLVRLSPQSAYAFRRTAKGRAFDLGWRVADLLARERVAADLFIRAVEGQEHQTTRADGSVVTRFYRDNRLAVTMLNRLDRYADASENTAPGHAARVVAGDFEAYLRLVEGEGGPARAGLFMLAHGADGEPAAAELQPVLALARADRLLRCGTVDADLPVADLDPARRADWTAEQWARAEAAGLVALAPPPPPEPAPKLAPEPACTPVAPDPRLDARDLKALRKLQRYGLGLDGTSDLGAGGQVFHDGPVWWDHRERAWRTSFPPPVDFDGEEWGEWADEGYQRELTPEEEEVAWERLSEKFGLVTLEDAEEERDEWFGVDCEGAAGESGDLEEIDATPASPASEAGQLAGPNSSDVPGRGRPRPALGGENQPDDVTPQQPPSTRQPSQHPEDALLTGPHLVPS